jgi:hypothetical protein
MCLRLSPAPAGCLSDTGVWRNVGAGFAASPPTGPAAATAPLLRETLGCGNVCAMRWRRASRSLSSIFEQVVWSPE